MLIWGVIVIATISVTERICWLLRAEEQAQEALRLGKERLDLALDGSNEGLWDWDISSGAVHFSPRWELLLGYLPGEIEPHVRAWSGLIHPEDLPGVTSALEAHMVGNAPSYQTEHRVKTKSGNWIWVLDRGKVVKRTADGQPLRAVGTYIDITERRRVDEDLRLAASVFLNISEAILITDTAGTILSVNPAFTDITGFSAEEAIGKSPRLLKSDHHADEFYRGMWSELRETGRWQGEIWNRRKDGGAYLQWQTISAVLDGVGLPVRYVSVFTDITELHQKDERIKHQAYHDALTGLPNRLLLLDRLEQALAVARRDLTRVAVLFLDLDRFKLVNDSLGHDVGDRLLVTVAKRLQNAIARSDTVARLGGDEFVLVLGDFASTADVAHVAERLIVKLLEPVKLDGHKVHVTTSIGISIFPQDGEDARTMLRNADTAMYRAKEEGRNTFRFFDQSMTTRALERLDLEADLRQALERNQFMVYFQPKVSLSNHTILGLEALIRWCHPKRGMVSPLDFIPLAEETGLIVPIGAWVLRAACEQNQRWRAAGLPPLPVAVNLSARQFLQPNLVETIFGILSDSGLPPNALEIELTESTVMSNSEQAIMIMRRLYEVGVRISVDDFGTGYSSLAYLKKLPISTLKIDRSFITDLVENGDDAAIVQTIIALGRSLRLEVVAEGVETIAQANFLDGNGCAIGQGFYFAKPMPGDQFPDWLGENQSLVSAG
ncbi:diguanylate cyclase [uncultured Gammaproteobacteria bacterium]